MTEEIERYNHSQTIEWLEKKFEKEKIYKDLEESPEFQADVKEAKDREKEEFFVYPQLSIDLIWVREESERIDEDQIEKANGRTKKIFNHYTLFFAVSSKAIFEEEMKDLKRRLLFYQFYLSRISEPKRFQIIVVVPHNVDVPEQSLKFFEENGFGLWKVKIGKEDEKEEEVYHPKSLRTRMIEEFKVSVDEPENLGETIEKIFKKENLKDLSTFKKAIKEKENAEGFAIFFDQYILDAVDAIAGVTPDEFGKRYIDRRLLNLILMSKLEKVSYGKMLVELVNEHLDENKDDYQFVSEAFSSLWEENIGIPYSNFLMTFEPALLHVFAEGEEKREKIYRDHYIHQFQVFLLGTYIIDKFYDTFKKLKKPEISWLIAASFHDMAYPVQLYDGWVRGFFQKVFNVPIKLAQLELKSNFVDQSFLSCMGYLICSLYLFHKDETVKGNWIADKNELVQFFYQEITEGKNHCILSSMSLLKIVQDTNFNKKNTIKKKISHGKDKFEDILKEVFVPSALAIALHDKEIWQKLRKESDKDNPPKILDNLEFEKDPLSFLLIFCDNVQEWGRPSKSQEKEEDEKRRRFYLKEFICDSNGVKITLWTPNYTKEEKFFQKKQDELRELEGFLQQTSAIKFSICLRDKDNEVENFSMEGTSSS